MTSPYDICDCGHHKDHHASGLCVGRMEDISYGFAQGECGCDEYHEVDGEEPRYGDVSVAEECERADRIQRELKR